MRNLLDRIKAKTKQIEGLLTRNKMRQADDVREGDAKRAAERVRNAVRRHSIAAAFEET